MKTVAAGIVSLIIGITLFPVLITGGDVASRVCGIAAGPIEDILATIRQFESGNNYTAEARGSTASGAYQFLDTSWNGYGGYGRAKDAPPAVQDAKAADWVQQILIRNDGDLTAVPVTWYIGHVPPPESPEWDLVPYPNAGNTITPRQYLARWLALHGDRATSDTTTTDPNISPLAGPAECSAAVTPDGYALPVPRSLIDANPGMLDKPHHDYPAWDFGIPIGKPIYAMRAGTVTRITNSPSNCYPDGIDCDKCGLGVVVTDTDKTEWTYCHASAVMVSVAAEVAAGQQIMQSGNSGYSSGPHLHLGIRVRGVDVCPQPLLRSIQQTGNRIEMGNLGATGCIGPPLPARTPSQEPN